MCIRDRSDAEKIVLNSEYIFPETNFRDNYLYTKGIFANQKRIKLKLLKDIPNPEFNEIYINPRMNFNAVSYTHLDVYKRQGLP